MAAIWVGIDGGVLVSTHMRDNQKLRNIRREPRVVLSCDVPRESGVWLSPYVTLTARVDVGQRDRILELMDRRARNYVGPEEGLEAPEGPPPGHLVRCEVTRIGGVGPWVADTGR